MTKLHQHVGTLLIVEDSQTQAEILKCILEENNYKAYITANGKEALSVLRKVKFDLIISDLNMPEMDGLDFCLTLKSDPGLKDIPVILLTVFSESENVIRAWGSGVDHFLAKPYEPEYLVTKISEILSSDEEDICKRFPVKGTGDTGILHDPENIRMLRFALSTYNMAAEQNRLLLAAKKELKELNDQLNERVLERTAQLAKVNEDLLEDIEKRILAEEEVLQLNRIYAVLSNINQMIVREKDEQTILDSACQIAVNEGKFRMAWIGKINPETHRVDVISKAGYLSDCLDKLTIDISDHVSSSDPTGTALRTQQYVVVDAIETDERMTRWKTEALKNGYRSSAAFPLIVSGKTYGTINLYSDKEGFFTDEEIRLLNEMAMDISFAIETIQTEEQKRKAEKQLDAANKKFTHLMSNLNDIFWTASVDGSEILDVNDSFERVYGRSADEFRKNPGLCMEVVHPDDKAVAERSSRELYKNGKTQAEYRILRPDGEIVWLLDRKSLICDENGKPVQMGGIGKDITERKLAEEALRLQSAMLNNLAEGVYLINASDGRIIYTNPQFDKMFGYNADELIGKHVTIVNAPGDSAPEETASEIMEALNKKDTWGGEILNIRKDGTTFWSYANVSTFEHHELGKVWVSVHQDISKEKETMNLVLRQKDLGYALSIAAGLEEVYDITFKTISESTGSAYGAIFLIDKNSTALYLEHSSGISPDSVKALSRLDENSENMRIIFEGKPFYIENLKEPVTVSGYELPEKITSIAVIPLHQGDSIIGNLNIAFQTKERITDFERRAMESFAILLSHAISRFQYEKELIRAKVTAEESNLLKSRFLANMSHEIRTPMNGILGFMSLLNEPDLTSENKSAYISIVNKCGQRLLTTLNDIIEMSKIEAGILQADLVETNPSEVLKDIASFFRLQVAEKNLNLTCNLCKDERLSLMTDRHKLEGILINLLKNAVKYTETGSIETGYYMEEGTAVFYVRDTGMGIPKEQLDAIFERFIQVESSDVDPYARPFEGSGLGLSIAKAYAGLLGGRIWVDSEVGQGSTFYLSLPYIPAGNKVQKRERTPHIQSIIYPGLTILIAEDDEDSYGYLKVLIEKTGASHIHVTNGKDAIDALDCQPCINMILMDIKMPGMNGLEATRVIRKSNQKIPIIAQTAYAFPSDKAAFFEAGCNDYLEKPIKKEKLLDVIAKFAESS